MNGKYEAAAIAVKNAEQTLATLKDFANVQYKAKGETMREQIANYIADMLADANYMLGSGCLHYELSLSKSNKEFVFYIKDSFPSSFRTPIFSINTNGKIKYHRELTESMMVTIMHQWEGFKESLDFAIKATLKIRTDSINKEIAHIAYVNEQLSKWKV